VNFEDEFKDQVALVAGGAGALGGAVARAFLAAGARVVVTYRKRAEFNELYAAAGAGTPQRLSGVTVDVTDAAATAAAAQDIAASQSRLDILVNTVGGYAGGKKVWEDDAAMLQRMVALNLQSGFALARAVLPVMIRQNRGCIVNVASRAGYGESPTAALYAASKAGALALFSSLAAEVKPYAIRVNTVVPSIFDTPANRQAMPSADFSRWPKPEEIARVILFLCSSSAQVIHGAAIPVYGKT
jgi:NAD(P)-dependent dehydrogenase (short-subunit alcohol dehydrogenase family)